jgi:hypothetical protein
LAEQIVRFLRAAKNIDTRASTTSRLFGSNEKSYDVLLNHLVWQFLQNLDTLKPKSESEWEDHLTIHGWNRSDWSMPWTMNASTSSHWGRYSNRAAEYVFRKLMTGTALPVTPDIALKGQAELSIHGFVETAGGSPSKVNKALEKIQSGALNINGGVSPWTAGADRSIIQFEVPQNGLGSIVKGMIEWKDGSGNTGQLNALANNTKTQYLNLSDRTAPMEVTLHTCSFSDKSLKVHNFTIQW